MLLLQLAASARSDPPGECVRAVPGTPLQCGWRIADRKRQPASQPCGRQGRSLRLLPPL